MRPSLAARSLFLAAISRPRFLNNVLALVKSPLASSRAFLQSITPQDVSSLRRLKSPAVAIICNLRHVRANTGVRPYVILNGRYFLGLGRDLCFFARQKLAAAFKNAVGDQTRDELDGFNRIVIARDGILDQVRVGIGVNDTDDG